MSHSYYQWLWYGTIGLHCLSAVVILMVVIYYLVQYICNQKQTDNIRLPIKILTIIGSIACLACAISDGLTVYIDKDQEKFKDAYYNTQVASHAMNNLMTYFIYLYRLHLSFKDTMYRLTPFNYAFLTTFITLDLLDFCGDSFAYFYDDSWLLIYMDIFGLVTESMISIICLWYFNKNLLNLMLKMRTSVSIFDIKINNNFQESPYSHSQGIVHRDNLVKSPMISYENMTNDKIARIINEKTNNKHRESMMDHLNERQRKLIDRIVRNALLCSMTMFFWTLERIAWFVFIFLPGKDFNANLMFVAKCLTATALMIDAVCMLFTFKFASSLYGSFCVLCDKGCHSCCGYIAGKYADTFE